MNVAGLPGLHMHACACMQPCLGSGCWVRRAAGDGSLCPGGMPCTRAGVARGRRRARWVSRARPARPRRRRFCPRLFPPQRARVCARRSRGLGVRGPGRGHRGRGGGHAGEVCVRPRLRRGHGQRRGVRLGGGAHRVLRAGRHQRHGVCVRCDELGQDAHHDGHGRRPGAGAAGHYPAVCRRGAAVGAGGVHAAAEHDGDLQRGAERLAGPDPRQPAPARGPQARHRRGRHQRGGGGVGRARAAGHRPRRRQPQGGGHRVQRGLLPLPHHHPAQHRGA